ncbi:hypothetical protein SAE01_07160 [Segetibacter aerophilus]|uniref:Uncharacterized protein n=2 Tax=Segetibacter aerophilus TaxID=670293 RepID=A0A512B8D7_9BACT|nr:hypothetical protein SAE01_07160 [Segetibacter aerophilus]
MLAFLCSTLFSYSLSAQKSAAKCEDFTAKVTNGSVLNLCSGSSISLAAEPAISGYTFQWQVQTNAGGPFMSIPGATGATYAVNNLGAYRVYITTGSCVDTSGITSVIRITPEGGKIVAATKTTICQGEPGGLIEGNQVPGADVGIITYSWERNEANSGWTTINDASTQNFTATHIFKTTSFRRVSNDNCGNKAYSNIVTLLTAPDVISGLISPKSQTITAGATPSTITSGSAPSGGSGSFSYQWQSSLYENATFTNIAGATSADYSPGPLTQTTFYKRIATDLRCYTTAATSVATIFVVNAPLLPGTYTLNSSCFYKDYPLTTPIRLTTNNAPTGGVPPYKVEWQSSTDDKNFVIIPNQSGGVYEVGPLTQSTYFRKKVTDAAGSIAYTGSEKITMVETPLTGGSIKAASNVACLGSSPAEISSTGSPTGYGEGLYYQWQYMNTSSGGWKDFVGQIRASFTPEPITEKTTFRRLAIDQCGANKRSVASNEVTIDIRPALIAGDIEPTSQTIRSGRTPVPLKSVADPSGGTGSYTIAWENADLAVGPWATIPSQVAVSYQPPALTKSAYYRRAVTDNNCLATKYTYVVEVYLNTAPPIDPCHLGGSQCVFPGHKPGAIDGGNMKVTGGVPPYTYTWETKAITAGLWKVISGATSEGYQPESISQSTQYRRKVIDAVGDFAYSDPFTIEYHTAALVPGSIAIKSSHIVCAGSAAGLIESISGVSGYGENPLYQWQMKKEGGDWINIAGANEETYQPVNITARTYFRRVVTDACGGVIRTATSNEVIYDLPVMVKLHAGLVDGPFITCAGTAPGTIKSVLDACGGGSSLHYRWEMLQGGSWQMIAGETSASYTPGPINENTTYRRRVYDDCGNLGFSNAVEIFVYPPIEPGVIGTATQLVCLNQAPEKIRLMTNCHYTDGAVTYQWQTSTSTSGAWSNITGATTSEYQPNASPVNMYFRLMVRSTTCAAVAYTNVASVLVNTGCSAANARVTPTSSEIKVYPNPLTGNSIKVEGDLKGKVSVRLLNAEGRAIPTTVSQQGSGLMNVFIPGVRSTGVYVLTIADEKASWTKKIVIQ